MALTIRNAEAEQLAAELAKTTGESKTEAVTKALRDRLVRVRRERVPALPEWDLGAIGSLHRRDLYGDVR